MIEPFDVDGPVVGQERVRARVAVDAVALDPAVDSLVPVVLAVRQFLNVEGECAYKLAAYAG